MNFWGYLLSGGIQVFGFFTAPFPVAQPNELLTSAPGVIASSIVPAYFWTSPLLDLRLIGIALGVVMVLEIIRAVIAIWRWILTLIPAAS